MGQKSWPLLATENHDRDLTGFKILLLVQVLVRGNQNIEAVVFRSYRQVTVYQPRPALLRRRAHHVSRKVVAKGQRRALIEKNPHFSG